MLRFLNRWFSSSTSAHSRRKPRSGSFRPMLETLEDRLIPTVSLFNGYLTILGTSSSDSLTLTAPAVNSKNLQVTLNGATSTYDITKIQSISINGSGGNDFAFLYASSSYWSTVNLTPAGGTLSGSGPSIKITKMPNISVYGDPACTATLQGGTGTNTLRGSQFISYEYGSGYYNLVSGFSMVTAIGGGSDVAYLSGNSKDDFFDVLAPSSGVSLVYSELSSALTYYHIRAQGFTQVHASTSGGGSTTAQLHNDVAPNATFTGKGSYAELSSPAFDYTASGFGSVSADGADQLSVAYLYDTSAGNATLTARPLSATLSGPGYSNQAKGFTTVYAYASAGVADTANMYDSSDGNPLSYPGNSYFVATPTCSTLYGTPSGNYYNQANGFTHVNAYAANSAVDTAYFFDSGLGHATFIGKPTSCEQYGSGYDNVANSFGSVYAYPSAGASDTAILDDLHGANSVLLTSSYAQMTGTYPTFSIYASGYGHVVANAMGGTDKVTLTDTTGGASLGATPTYAQMYGSGFFNETYGFASITAHGTGQDTAYLYDLPNSVSNRFDGDGSTANLWGYGYSINAYSFACVTVYASQGNADTVNDVNWGHLNYALSLQGPGYWYYPYTTL